MSAASKRAFEAMSEALHWEAAPAGIRVHVIDPGRFPTTGFHANVVRPNGSEGSDFEVEALTLRVALDHQLARLMTLLPTSRAQVLVAP
jgi:NAD(P)-dependent dehydrogenase (short-subunit alcohol dehydrogenase family)